LEKQKKKVSKRVLGHVSLILRLQRLYAVRRHVEEHRDDGILRHPADSNA